MSAVEGNVFFEPVNSSVSMATTGWLTGGAVIWIKSTSCHAGSRPTDRVTSKRVQNIFQRSLQLETSQPCNRIHRGSCLRSPLPDQNHDYTLPAVALCSSGGGHPTVSETLVRTFSTA